MRTVIKSAIMVVGLLMAAPSSAATLVSLDRATFQASAGSLSSQSFDSLLSGNVLTFDGFVTYSTNGGTPIVTSTYLTSTNPNGLGASNVGFFTGANTLTLTFSSALTAFAMDINTFATAAGSYDVLLNTGDQAFSIFETFPGAGTGQFIGFVSNTPFTSLTLKGTGFSYTVDTLLYGLKENVQTGAVPEPATWLMMLIGFGAIGFSMRSKKKSSPRVQFA